MHKTRGEIASLVLISGLIIASLTSVITVSFFRSQKISYKSSAIDINYDALCYECSPAGQQGGCPAGYTCKTMADATCGGLKYYCAKDATTSTTTSTGKCPAGVGTYAVTNGPGLCNSQCSSQCKKCLLNNTEKYYCPSSGNTSESRLPSCTTPNAFSKSTCETSCGGANSCEQCQIPNGPQKFHCKTNNNTQNLNRCSGGSYTRKADCNPHCFTQCRECKINTTIKYECPAGFNQNIPNCSQSRTYSSEVSCKAPNECTGSCTICQSAPGVNRYECNGQGPTVPLTQTPVGLGDCNSSIVAGGHIANGQTTCSVSGSYTVTCNNGTTTTKSCAGKGCTGGKCNEPSPIPSPTPIKTSSGASTYTCGQGLTCPSGWSCNGPYIPYGYGVRYCTEDAKPTPTAWCEERLIQKLNCAHSFCKAGERAEEWILANCDKQIKCKADLTCVGVPTPAPNYAHDASIKCEGNNIVKNGAILQSCNSACAVGTNGPYCPNTTSAENTFATSCQYTCRKYNCSSNEIQVAQSCTGIDMACCRVPENKDDIAGKTCYNDSDCGDIAKNECKFDPVTKQRYCTARITPLDTTTNTQCTSLNIGFSCQYTSGGNTYFGTCGCANNSCSCKAEVGSPIAPTTSLLSPAEAHEACTAGSCCDGASYCSKKGLFSSKYECRSCPISQICASGSCVSVSCQAGDKPFRNEKGVCQACYAINSTPTLMAVNESLCAKADYNPNYYPQPGEIATNALSADDAYKARQDIYNAIKANPNAPVNDAIVTALQAFDALGHLFGEVGETFNQGLYEITGGKVGDYTSDQAGSSFGNYYQKQMEANTAAAATGDTRFDITNPNSFVGESIEETLTNLGNGVGDAVATGVLGTGQYMANTLLGLPAAVSFEPAQKALEAYTEFNKNQLNKIYNGKEYEVEAATATQYAGGDLTDTIALLVPAGKGISAVGDKISDLGSSLKTAGTAGKVAGSILNNAGDVIDTAGRVIQKTSPESWAAGFIKSAPITRTFESMTAKIAAAPVVRPAIGAVKTATTAILETPVIGPVTQTVAKTTTAVADFTKSLLLPESSLTYSLDDAGRFLAKDAERGLVDLTDPTSLVNRLNDTYGINLKSNEVHQLAQSLQQVGVLPTSQFDDFITRVVDEVNSPKIPQLKNVDSTDVETANTLKNQLDERVDKLGSLEQRLVEQNQIIDDLRNSGTPDTNPAYIEAKQTVVELQEKVQGQQALVTEAQQALTDYLAKINPELGQQVTEQATKIAQAQKNLEAAKGGLDIDIAHQQLTAAQKNLEELLPQKEISPNRGVTKPGLKEQLSSKIDQKIQTGMNYDQAFREAVNELGLDQVAKNDPKINQALETYRKTDAQLSTVIKNIGDATSVLNSEKRQLVDLFNHQTEAVVQSFNNNVFSGFTKTVSEVTENIKQAGASLLEKPRNLIDNIAKKVADVKNQFNDWWNEITQARNSTNSSDNFTASTPFSKTADSIEIAQTKTVINDLTKKLDELEKKLADLKTQNEINQAKQELSVLEVQRKAQIEALLNEIESLRSYDLHFANQVIPHNPFDVLGLDPNTLTSTQINVRKKQLAQALHPDINAINNPALKSRFDDAMKSVNQSSAFLKELIKKKQIQKFNEWLDYHGIRSYGSAVSDRLNKFQTLKTNIDDLNTRLKTAANLEAQIKQQIADVTNNLDQAKQKLSDLYSQATKQKPIDDLGGQRQKVDPARGSDQNFADDLGGQTTNPKYQALKKNRKTSADFLRQVDEAIKRGDVNNPALSEFWRSLVRDYEGRWVDLQDLGYFHGQQAVPDLSNKKFVNASLAARQKILDGFNQGIVLDSYFNFKNWLTDVHKSNSYKTANMPGEFRVAEGYYQAKAHTKIVLTEIKSIMQKLGQKYNFNGNNTVNLWGIPKEGLPRDSWFSGANKSVLTHYYPEGKFIDDYLQLSQQYLKRAMDLDLTVESRLISMAKSYQYAINVRPYKQVNQSLFMNIANTVLSDMGLKPIEQGIMDFAAMRLQPDNFAIYFVNEVRRVNPNIELQVVPIIDF